MLGMAAVHNAVSARSSRSSLSLGSGKSTRKQKKLEKRNMNAQCLFQQYGPDKNGKLRREQVRILLEDLGHGEPVSDYELEYVLRAAATRDDKGVFADEASGLLDCWNRYQRSRKDIEGHFQKYDPNGRGYLDRGQLRDLLVELNKGRTVTDAKVNWVLRQADVLKNDVITKPELRRVLALSDYNIESREYCTVQ